MKLLKNTESKINRDKNVENMPYLEIAEVVYDIVTTIDWLLDISPKNFIFLNTFNSEFSYINWYAWSTEQNYYPNPKIKQTLI